MFDEPIIIVFAIFVSKTNSSKLIHFEENTFGETLEKLDNSKRINDKISRS